MWAAYYLPVTTQKIGNAVGIKLPAYTVDIIVKFKETTKGRKTIFPPIPLNRFNKQQKTIAELTGWTNNLGRRRTKRGILFRSMDKDEKTQFRFCDLVSSHTMRRTAITTLLCLGMPEHIVRKISGHSPMSKEFFRYVALAQSYQDSETSQMFEKLKGKTM